MPSKNNIYHCRSDFIKSFFSQIRANPPSSYSFGPAALYAVFLNEIGFYGVGGSRAEAIKNASRWLADEPDIHTTKDWTRKTERATLCVVRCTPRFAEKLFSMGGCAWIPYSISPDGVFDIQ
jgi:hypothetical protein